MKSVPGIIVKKAVSISSLTTYYHLSGICQYSFYKGKNQTCLLTYTFLDYITSISKNSQRIKLGLNLVQRNLIFKELMFPVSEQSRPRDHETHYGLIPVSFTHDLVDFFNESLDVPLLTPGRLYNVHYI